MPVISLVSAKGSPGVTTTAATLTTVAVCTGQPSWWVELDPSGGSGWVRARQSCPQSEPTLADVARDLRETGASAVGWMELADSAPPGVPSVLAPSAPRAAASVIAEGPDTWAASLRAPGTVVVDAGRWSPRQQTASRIVGSDVVAAVCRSTVEGVEHVRHWVAELREVARCPVMVVVVGTHPYGAGDVAAATGLSLAGVMEWRRSDVGALWARGASKNLLRSWLGRSASHTLSGLVDAATQPTAGSRLAERVRTREAGPAGRARR
jgi:hypothetical protein